jgi:membrane-associated phospholipid phosphatase
MSAQGSRTLAVACWLCGLAILALGAWLVCYAPNCAANPTDAKIIEWFSRQHNAAADELFRAVTWLGSVVVLMPLVIGSVVALALHRRIREAYFLAVALVGTIVIMYTSKLIVARPRPNDIDALIAMPWDQSFPSAHTAQIVSVMLAGLMIIYRLNRIWFKSLWPVALITVVLVALSRIYLQVHYLSDVLVGATVGVLWVCGLALLVLHQTKERQKE